MVDSPGFESRSNLNQLCKIHYTFTKLGQKFISGSLVWGNVWWAFHWLQLQAATRDRSTHRQRYTRRYRNIISDLPISQRFPVWYFSQMQTHFVGSRVPPFKQVKPSHTATRNTDVWQILWTKSSYFFQMLNIAYIQRVAKVFITLAFSLWTPL